MGRAALVMVVGAAVLASSGCASTKSAQDLRRLQSQVGLLDERVGQLERSSVGWQQSSSIPAAPAVTFESSPSASKTSAAATGAVSSKPTTRQVQQALKNAGFYQGAVDDKMGPVTRDAIREFQRVHGLKDDGIVGAQTWTKLSAYADLSGSGGELNAAEILK